MTMPGCVKITRGILSCHFCSVISYSYSIFGCNFPDIFYRTAAPVTQPCSPHILCPAETQFLHKLRTEGLTVGAAVKPSGGPPWALLPADLDADTAAQATRGAPGRAMAMRPQHGASESQRGACAGVALEISHLKLPLPLPHHRYARIAPHFWLFKFKPHFQQESCYDHRSLRAL